MRLLAQLLLNALPTGAMYAMMATGFGLAYRSTAVFHLAYGGLYVVACYLLLTSTKLLGLPLFVSLPLAVAGTGVLGVLIEKAVYLPLYRRRASSGAVMVASLGVFTVIENAVALAFGNEAKTLSSGIEPSARLWGLVMTRMQIVQLAVGVAAVLAAWIALRRWSIMKAFWAMGDEPELIPVVGLPARHLRALVFLLSSVMIAVPACLVSLDVGMDPHAGMGYLLVAAVAVFFGGVDSFHGWVIGGVSLAFLQSLAVWTLSARWTELVTFGLLVAILLFRPQGLLGSARRIEEMAT